MASNNLTASNFDAEKEDTKLEQPSKEEIDQFKKNRRAYAKSLDVSSKVFVPSSRPAPDFAPPMAGFVPPTQPGFYPQNFYPGQPAYFPQAMGQPFAAGPQTAYFGANFVDPTTVNLEYKVQGRLKFFNESQNYGFIVSDIDGKDIFFHYDDMKKTNLSKQFLKDAKNKFIVRFLFKVMGYYGKYNMSKKSVDIDLVKIEPIYQGMKLPDDEGGVTVSADGDEQ